MPTEDTGPFLLTPSIVDAQKFLNSIQADYKDQDVVKIYDCNKLTKAEITAIKQKCSNYQGSFYLANNKIIYELSVFLDFNLVENSSIFHSFQKNRAVWTKLNGDGIGREQQYESSFLENALILTLLFLAAAELIFFLALNWQSVLAALKSAESVILAHPVTSVCAGLLVAFMMAFVLNINTNQTLSIFSECYQQFSKSEYINFPEAVKPNFVSKILQSLCCYNPR